MSLFKHIQTIIASVLLVILGSFGGYYFGVRGYEVNLKKDVRQIEIINKEAELPKSVDFSRFWTVWDDVNQSHISHPFDPNELVSGAIKGMVEAIGDPYTSYLDTQQNIEITASLNGEYEGIGAQLGFDEESRLIIVAPLDGSPAYFIGIRAGDRILQIEGEDTTGISIEEAVNKIRGKAGTVSTLTLFRKGTSDPFEIKITRDKIKVDSVTWEDKGDGIAYIRLSRFGDTTNQEWAKVANEIVQQMPNLKGIVLDVRNNPGGYLESAVYVGSEFVSKGVVVKESFSDGTMNEFQVDHAGLFTDNKLLVAVLINEGSASASEIVAGSLKESRGALLVGARSFGKGTVQKSEEYTDGAALHVTIAKWLTPKGNWVDKHNSKFADSVYNTKDENGKEIIGGLKPDYEVNFTDEDITAEKDVQLEKAIEVLRPVLE